MANEPKVALLGTGIMGAAMGRQLLGAGVPLTVWNRSGEKARPLVDGGAAWAETPEQATAGADLVVTMLSDGPTVAEVMLDDGGLGAMRRDALWLQMSTVGLEWADRLAAAAADVGVGFVDAPVAGTRQPAEKGELLVLASAPEGLRGRSQPVFDRVGRKTLWVGEAQEGSRLKVVVNSWLVSLVGALAETVSLAEAVDLDPAVFLEAIAGGPLDAPFAQLKGRAMIDEAFPPAFPLKHALKDVRLAIEASEERGLPLRIARAVREVYERAEQEGHGDEDLAAVYHAAQPRAWH